MLRSLNGWFWRHSRWLWGFSAEFMPAGRTTAVHWGIRLTDRTKGSDAAGIFPIVGAALDLLAGADWKRLTRMQRDVAEIALVDGWEGLAFFWSGSRTIFIDAHFIRQHASVSQPATAAVILVHEATHARLDRLRLPPLPRVRRRCEARALREEVAFGMRLPVPEYASVREWIRNCVRKSRDATPNAMREADQLMRHERVFEADPAIGLIVPRLKGSN